VLSNNWYSTQGVPRGFIHCDMSRNNGDIIKIKYKYFILKYEIIVVLIPVSLKD